MRANVNLHTIMINLIDYVNSYEVIWNQWFLVQLYSSTANSKHKFDMLWIYRMIWVCKSCHQFRLLLIVAEFDWSCLCILNWLWLCAQFVTHVFSIDYDCVLNWLWLCTEFIENMCIKLIYYVVGWSGYYSTD